MNIDYLLMVYIFYSELLLIFLIVVAVYGVKFWHHYLLMSTCRRRKKIAKKMYKLLYLANMFPGVKSLAKKKYVLDDLLYVIKQMDLQEKSENWWVLRKVIFTQIIIPLALYNLKKNKFREKILALQALNNFYEYLQADFVEELFFDSVPLVRIFAFSLARKMRLAPLLERFLRIEKDKVVFNLCRNLLKDDQQSLALV